MTEIYLGVGIDASEAQSGANQFSSATNKVSNAANKATRANEKFQQQLNHAKLALLAFSTIAANYTIKTISEYRYSLAEAAAVTNATASQMVQLEQVTRQLGATTMFSASQAAEGVKFLGMAGFKTNEIIAALPATLDLAAAATLSMGQAADIASNIMSGFGISANKMSEIADVLASVASRANTDVSGMGQAMKFVGPVAKSLGISMQDTAAAVGVLANAGIQGGMAGRGLRTSLVKLLKPSRQAKQAIADLGLKMSQVNPQTHSLVEIMKTFSKAGLDATSAAKIFGQEGLTAMLALTSSVPELERLTKATNNAKGEAKRMADIMKDNLRGDAEIAKSALSELALTIGDLGLTKAVRNFLKTSTDWITYWSKSLKGLSENKDAMTAFESIISVTTYSLAALMAIKLADWLFVAGNAMRLLNVAMMANPYVALGVGLAGLAGKLIELQNETRNWTNYTNEQTKALENMTSAAGIAANKTKLAMLQNQAATLQTTAAIDAQIKSIRTRMRARAEEEKAKFGARGKPAGYNDAGTFSNIQTVQDARDLAELAAQKNARAALDAQIKNTEAKIAKMESNLSSSGYKAGRRLGHSFITAVSSIKASDIKGFLSQFIPGLGGEKSGASSIVVPITPKLTTSSNLDNLNLDNIFGGDSFDSFANGMDGVLDVIDKTNEATNNYIDLNNRVVSDLAQRVEAEQMRNKILKEYGSDMNKVNLELEIYNEQKKLNIFADKEQIAKIREETAALYKIREANDKVTAAKKRQERAEKQWAQTMTYAFKDAIMNSKNLGDALNNLANRVENMLVNKALDSLLGGVFSGLFAKGAAFKAGSVTPFASGGIVNKPTIFPMANGMGLMGEAGAEAVMPLTRTSNGDLGVRAIGDGGSRGSIVMNNVFNINAAGGSEKENKDAGIQISKTVMRMLDDKIMKVIQREKRPGGSLK